MLLLGSLHCLKFIADELHEGQTYGSITAGQWTPLLPLNAL
jgi:hypothetical protein